MSVQTKPTVPDVISLVQDYYAQPLNGAGGSLHIVLDDGNVEDGSVDHCIEFAKESGDVDGERLGQLLRSMSATQRKRLYRCDKHRFDSAARGGSNGS
jgi:hypothetical protein